MDEQPPYIKRKISLPRLKHILYLLCDICGEKYTIIKLVRIIVYIVVMII